MDNHYVSLTAMRVERFDGTTLTGLRYQDIERVEVTRQMGEVIGMSLRGRDERISHDVGDMDGFCADFMSRLKSVTLKVRQCYRTLLRSLGVVAIGYAGLHGISRAIAQIGFDELLGIVLISLGIYGAVALPLSKLNGKNTPGKNDGQQVRCWSQVYCPFSKSNASLQTADARGLQ